VSLVLSGDWLEDGTGLEIEAVESAAGGQALRLRFGREEATLFVDPDTCEPRRLELRPNYGARSWTFQGLGPRGGLVYPSCVEPPLPGGRLKRFVIEDVVRSKAAPGSFFAAPARARASFDTAAPAEIAVERSRLGLLMVHPRIDGRDVGGFIFDT